MLMNFTFDHDEHFPFGTDEKIKQNEYFSLLITSIIFLFGFVGNLMMVLISFYILRRSFHGEKRTLEHFLLELSLFDSLVLVYHLFNSIVRYKSMENTDTTEMTGLINVSHVACKLLTYIIRVSTLMSHWLMIILILNRLFLVHLKFHRLIAIINAKYAIVGLLFIFTLFNVPSIESISFNEPIDSKWNLTLKFHCLLNVDMENLHTTIHSSAILFNVFFYSIIGLILPTILVLPFAILLINKGSTLWKELRRTPNSRENLSLRYDSPIFDFLRTYKTVFALAIAFFLLSTPSKLFRFLILFISDHFERFSSTKSILENHGLFEIIGNSFELMIYSYKFYICSYTNHRFRCAMKYLFHYRAHRHHRFSTRNSDDSRIQRVRWSQIGEDSPLETLYQQLQVNEFESPIHIYRTSLDVGLHSQRSSFKTRSSISSRRTKEDEISL